MPSKASIFWLSFSGKLLAAVFVAVCTMLGFGPDQWVGFIVEGLPQWITPLRARWTLLTLAGLGISSMLWLWSKTRADGATTENVNESSRISIVDLCRWAVEHDWQFTDSGCQHIFDFVRTLRDAGSTESVQFWGRKKQRVASMTRDRPLIKIPAEYWRSFQLDGISLLDISPTDGAATECETDNALTSTVADGNLTQRQLYRDIHVDREAAMRWLETEGVRRRGEYAAKDDPFDGLDPPFYLRDQVTDLTTAIFMMVHKSEWGRDNYESADLSSYLNDIREAMQQAAISVREAAIDGTLTIRGTKPGTSKQKRISTDDWKYAVLSIVPCSSRAWKVVATPNDGNWNRDNRAWRYEDLEVDSREFEKLWPV